jgi:hypothetical protein
MEKFPKPLEPQNCIGVYQRRFSLRAKLRVTAKPVMGSFGGGRDKWDKV